MIVDEEPERSDTPGTSRRRKDASPFRPETLWVSKPGIYTRVEGATGQTAADYRPFVRAVDGFNPAPFTYSQTPNERASVLAAGLASAR